MNDDHPTAGDYAWAEAQGANRKIDYLEGRLAKAERHIDYLVRVLNAVIEDVYGTDLDDLPASIVEAAESD